MISKNSVRRAALAASLMTMASISTALADAIDGDWCLGSKTLNILGPHIRTPGGTEMQGDYTRHTFNYTVPATEPEAGIAVAMRLQGQDFMAMTKGATAPETWRRCKPIS